MWQKEFSRFELEKQCGNMHGIALIVSQNVFKSSVALRSTRTDDQWLIKSYVASEVARSAAM